MGKGSGIITSFPWEADLIHMEAMPYRPFPWIDPRKCWWFIYYFINFFKKL